MKQNVHKHNCVPTTEVCSDARREYKGIEIDWRKIQP